MKKIVFLLILIIMFFGCARLTYQAPDGTKVTYSRLFTSSDIIKGKVGDASIEARGQHVIDPAALQAILSILGNVK